MWEKLTSKNIRFDNVYVRSSKFMVKTGNELFLAFEAGDHQR